MNTTTTVIPVDELTCQLPDAAGGIPAGTAAVKPIISHENFLHRADFRRIIRAGTSISTGQPLAVTGWDAAPCALAAGQMPCASSEQAIFRIAASLGDPEIPDRPRTVPGNPGTRNLTLAADAITAANG
jgi:hypothetical protein